MKKINCKFCGKEVIKTESDFKKSKNHYCSRRCAAKINLKNYINKPKGSCKLCQKNISKSLVYCLDCRKKRFDIKTLSDVIYTKHHRSSAYSLIRTRARALSKKLGWKECIKCGYDKHIEIAHIKAISTFPLGTNIEDVINHPSNLLPLCPNCHWEYDNLSVP